MKKDDNVVYYVSLFVVVVVFFKDGNMMKDSEMEQSGNKWCRAIH